MWVCVFFFTHLGKGRGAVLVANEPVQQRALEKVDVGGVASPRVQMPGHLEDIVCGTALLRVGIECVA